MEKLKFTNRPLKVCIYKHSAAIVKAQEQIQIQKDHLGMVSDTPFHWTSGIVMLHSKSYIGCQCTIILWYGTLNLISGDMKKNIFIRYSLKIIKGPNQTSFFSFSSRNKRINITLLRDLPLKLKSRNYIFLEEKETTIDHLFLKKIKEYRSRIQDKLYSSRYIYN